MITNARTISFGLLSGALMIVGSSMAFANPDQTSPREAQLPTACDTNCDAVPQTTSVTVDANSPTAVVDQDQVTADHDARKDRNRSH